MKKYSLFHQKLTFFIVLLVAILPLRNLSYATLIAPINFHQFYTSTSSQLYVLNSDMLMVSGGELSVVAWDEYGPGSAGVHFTVRDWNSGFVTQSIPNTTAEATPDVVLASDASGNYYVMIIYVDINKACFLEQYPISGVGTGTLTLGTPFIEAIKPPGLTWFPHIDMYADYNITDPVGFPTMHKFVLSVSGSVASGGGIGDVFAFWGDIFIPPPTPSGISVSPPQQVTFSGNCGMGGDIAASHDANSGLDLAYLVTSNSVFLEQYDIQVPGSIGTGVSVTGTINITASTTTIPGARIEAMAYNTGGQTPWVIGTCLWNGSMHETWQFNRFNLPLGENMSALDFSGLDNLSVNVCAGPGKLNGELCNENYNIGWHSRMYATRVIDAFTGAASTVYPDTYWADNPIVSYATGGKIPIGVTSTSNYGGMLMTSFWDNVSAIQYQLKPGIAGYKPPRSTNIEPVAENVHRIYPNPVINTLFVEHTDMLNYTISNLSGQMIKYGTLPAGKNEIETDGFSTGMYILNVEEHNKTSQYKFTKVDF